MLAKSHRLASLRHALPCPASPCLGLPWLALCRIASWCIALHSMTLQCTMSHCPVPHSTVSRRVSPCRFASRHIAALASHSGKHRSDAWPWCPQYLSPRIPSQKQGLGYPQGAPQGGKHEGHFAERSLLCLPVMRSSGKIVATRQAAPSPGRRWATRTPPSRRPSRRPFSLLGESAGTLLLEFCLAGYVCRDFCTWTFSAWISAGYVPRGWNIPAGPW